MANKSSIAWVNIHLVLRGKRVPVPGATWNFLYGCQKVSPLCRNCYAMWDVNRMAGHPNPKVSAGKAELVQLTNGQPQWTGKIQVATERLDLPLRWQQPRLIFVNSLSDLFYGGNAVDTGEVSFEVFCRFMSVMAAAPQHVYQVLTKRLGRANTYLRRYARELGGCSDDWSAMREFYERRFPHVWWGFSAGTQGELAQAELGLPQLPGAVRWLSMEPLTVPCSVRDLVTDRQWLNGGAERRLVDWIVPGGESKPAARHLDPDWIRNIAVECGYAVAGHRRDVAKLPLYVKQLGEPWARAAGAADRKGEDPAEWPEDLRIRDWPEAIGYLQARVEEYYRNRELPAAAVDAF